MSLSRQSAISLVNQCGSLKLCSSGCSAGEGSAGVAGESCHMGSQGTGCITEWGGSQERVKVCHSAGVSACVTP